MKSNNKSRTNNKYTIFKAKDEVKPYNTLSERQKIADGKQPFVNIDRSVFKKTAEERELLDVLKAGAHPRLIGGVPPLDRHSLPKRTTVHFVNENKNPLHKSTYFMMSKNPLWDAHVLAEAVRCKIKSVNVNGKIVLNNG